MNPSAHQTEVSLRQRCARWAGYAVCTVLLALALVRPPVALNPEPDVSYRSVLYETVRLGQTWGEDLVTTDGQPM